MNDEFGELHGRVLTRDLVIDELDGCTAEVAIANGIAVDTVWQALCRANEIPRERWYGRGLPARGR